MRLRFLLGQSDDNRELKEPIDPPGRYWFGGPFRDNCPEPHFGSFSPINELTHLTEAKTLVIQLDQSNSQRDPEWQWIDRQFVTMHVDPDDDDPRPDYSVVKEVPMPNYCEIYPMFCEEPDDNSRNIHKLCITRHHGTEDAKKKCKITKVTKDTASLTNSLSTIIPATITATNNPFASNRDEFMNSTFTLATKANENHSVLQEIFNSSQLANSTDISSFKNSMEAADDPMRLCRQYITYAKLYYDNYKSGAELYNYSDLLDEYCGSARSLLTDAKASAQSSYETQLLGGELVSGEYRKYLHSRQKGEIHFQITVPGRDFKKRDLFVNLDPGDGDADLYVRKGARPSKYEYDCRPYIGGTRNEKCTFTNAHGFTYYIMIRAYRAYKAASLFASYTQDDRNAAPIDKPTYNLEPDITRGIPDGGSKLLYKYVIDVPPSDDLDLQLHVRLIPGDGIAWLRVKKGALPTSKDYDCVSKTKGGVVNPCLMDKTTSGGKYYITVTGGSKVVKNYRLEANIEYAKGEH